MCLATCSRIRISCRCHSNLRSLWIGARSRSSIGLTSHSPCPARRQSMQSMRGIETCRFSKLRHSRTAEAGGLHGTSIGSPRLPLILTVVVMLSDISLMSIGWVVTGANDGAMMAVYSCRYSHAGDSSLVPPSRSTKRYGGSLTSCIVRISRQDVCSMPSVATRGPDSR